MSHSNEKTSVSYNWNWQVVCLRRVIVSGCLLLCGAIPPAYADREIKPASDEMQQHRQQTADSSNTSQDKKDEVVLEQGKPIERELAGGQSHSYRITLGAGQFLNVVVEQRGIDVVVTLFGQGDKQHAEFDGEIGSQGQETVSQVAEEAESYRIEVKPRWRGLPAGRYQIRLIELRAAMEKDRTLQEARQLGVEFIRLSREGKYKEARSLGERALEIREKVLGPEHPEVAASLSNLGNFYSNTDEYTKAESFYQRALAIREKALGPEHPSVARSLSNLGLLYSDRSEYSKAEPLYQRALAIGEKVLGAEHPDVATTFNNLGLLYSDQGDYPMAESSYQRALVIREKMLGPEHPDVAGSLNNLAILYSDQGDYARAEPLHQRALTIWEKVFGAEHPRIATSLNNLASIYRDQGNYAKAEQFFDRALTIRKKAFGLAHSSVAASLNNLAALSRDQGGYAKAESLYQQALDIWEKVFGLEHPNVAASLNNLALVYRDRGDYAKAEVFHRRALAMKEKVLNPEHPSVAASLSNLALLYLDQGDYAKAEPLFQRALAIREKAFGSEHFDVGGSISNLALLYHNKRDYTQAEPLYQRALVIQEKALGAEHPSVAESLQSLATLYRDQGIYAKAEPLYQRALAIMEKALGEHHPNIANALYNLAGLYRARGDTQRSITCLARSNEISEHNIRSNLGSGSERQKLAYLALFAETTNDTLSLHTQSAPADPQALHLALTTLLRRKGRGLDEMTDTFARLRRSLGPKDQAVLSQLLDIRSQQSTLAIRGPGPMRPNVYRARLTELEEQGEKLESELSARSVEFRKQTQPVTLEAVQMAIPDDAALVEFARYLPRDAKSGSLGPARYVIYALAHQGKPRVVDLGEAAPIERAIEAWRQALRSRTRQDVRLRGREADKLVMQPVRALLGERRRVLIVPDGSLNLIPFAALVDEQNQYLVNRYSFSYLTSGRDLLRLRVQASSEQNPMIVANPDFNESADKVAESQTVAKDKADDLLPFIADPLPGTEREAKALKAILPQAAVLTGKIATESALKQANSPSVLHIATHGFFLEDTSTAALQTIAGRGFINSSRDLVQPEAVGARLENPLLRSGLTLAGFNQRASGNDDGVLTAMEVAGMNLWGTKLVALSACETGVGEVKNGEGVYGLRRALVLAGAETQVMSLWRVSDQGTSELMIEYYKALRAREGRGEALRKVQLKMLANPKRRHPYYWAGFIQSGEWANLDGKR